MSKILLEDIEIFAYHGFLPEERKTGGWYVLNIELDVSFNDAIDTDKLDDTFDYQTAYDIVKQEMSFPSSLLEHVTNRITDKLLEASEQILSAKVKVSKLHPPVGGSVKKVSVEIMKNRVK